MRFNGKDPRELHPAISIAKEIPPGMANRRLRTLQGADGEIVTGTEMEGGRYIVRLNIAGKNADQGWAVRERIAAWAGSSGSTTAPLEPTHRPGRCYDAIIESVSDPEFVHGFTVIEATFFLPRPVARSAIRSNAAGAGGINADIGGSSPARPLIRQTLATAQSGVTWTMDGKPLLRMMGTFAAGQVIEMDTAMERLTLDGNNAMTLLDPQETRWRPGFTPGRHALASTDGGRMEMRWHEEWQ